MNRSIKQSKKSSQVCSVLNQNIHSAHDSMGLFIRVANSWDCSKIFFLLARSSYMDHFKVENYLRCMYTRILRMH